MAINRNYDYSSLGNKLKNRKDTSSESLQTLSYNIPVKPTDVFARALRNEGQEDEAPVSSIAELMAPMREDRNLYAGPVPFDAFNKSSQNQSLLNNPKTNFLDDFYITPVEKNKVPSVKPKGKPIVKKQKEIIIKGTPPPAEKKVETSSKFDMPPDPFEKKAEATTSPVSTPETNNKLSLPPLPETEVMKSSPGDITKVTKKAGEVSGKNISSFKNFQQLNWPEHGKALDAVYKQLAEAETKQYEAEKLHPHLTNPAAAAEYAKSLGKEHEKNLQDSIQKYTAGLNTNQKQAFWEKLIHAFGKMVAGGVGLATETPVGAYYAPTELLDKGEADKTTAAKFQAEKTAEDDRFKNLIETLNNEIEQYGKISDKSKEMLNLYKAILSEKSGITTTETKEQSYKDSYTQEILQTPWKTRDNNDKPVFNRLNWKEYSDAVTDLSANLNRYGVSLTKIADPIEFASEAEALLNKDSFGNKTGKYSITSQAILNRYREIRSKYPEGAGGSEQARIKVLQELKEMTTTNFLDTLGMGKVDAYKLAAKFGLPVELIKTEKGIDNLSFLSQNEDSKAAAPSAAKTTPSVKKPVQTQKRKITIMKKAINPTTKKEEQFTSTGEFSEADLAKLKEKGWSVVTGK